MKTHAEGIAESMGNLINIHSDKRRGTMDIGSVGLEAQIDCTWLIYWVKKLWIEYLVEGPSGISSQEKIKRILLLQRG